MTATTWAFLTLGVAAGIALTLIVQLIDASVTRRYQRHEDKALAVTLHHDSDAPLPLIPADAPTRALIARGVAAAIAAENAAISGVADAPYDHEREGL